MMRTAKCLLGVMLGFMAMGVRSPVAAEEQAAANGLLGYWLCESGDCPDEAIELADNDGVKTYNSWLHDRPSAVDGRWSLEGAHLVIRCCEDVEYEYTVVETGEERLVLQDADNPDGQIILHRPPSAGRRDEAGAGADAPAAP